MPSDVVGKSERYASFREFWPFYVREHARLGTRILHFIGSTLALVSVVAAVVTARPILLLGAPLFGYAFAWIGHFGIEKNRPATFKYPVYSLAADWVMYGKILAGTMRAEVAAATSRASNPPRSANHGA
jgi:hypothetical protein